MHILPCPSLPQQISQNVPLLSESDATKPNYVEKITAPPFAAPSADAWRHMPPTPLLYISLYYYNYTAHCA